MPSRFACGNMVPSPSQAGGHTMEDSLGWRIRFERIRRRMGQGTLAKKVSIHRNEMCLIEADRCDPRVSIVQSIARVLGVSIDYLVNGKQRPLP